MKNLISKVKEFSLKFKVNVSPIVTLINEREYFMRYHLMKEENEEYLIACKNGDIIEIADAIGDMLYVLNGTILEHGLQDKIIPIFEEIHRSNMSKLGDDGNPLYRGDGKVMKGVNYFKPNIGKILLEESKDFELK